MQEFMRLIRFVLQIFECICIGMGARFPSTVHNVNAFISTMLIALPGSRGTRSQHVNAFGTFVCNVRALPTSSASGIRSQSVKYFPLIDAKTDKNDKLIGHKITRSIYAAISHSANYFISFVVLCVLTVATVASQIVVLVEAFAALQSSYTHFARTLAAVGVAVILK